ncbi:DUF4440 domain-containing protein [Mycobacterium sp. 1482292.6]|uniref:nuclear transport factor 2 family protein n=1 Tax=Mycobacterium sp. 1482292.6 TaxID=1834081 RepID=UPI0007FF3AC0|nr:nuclear transport factor 2 family protein [Mycobacterium sp. 1482292.6]OBJ04241.1 DUF4440 domain-containing protein [Mycobacterium sp. 1482292.6]
MTNLQMISDRLEIEALRSDFTDAGVARDYDRFASLFTSDGAWRMPHINALFVGMREIRAAVERGQSLFEFFVQTVHSGPITLDGDEATGRAYVAEFGRLIGGGSHSNYGVYHDRYRRTREGWRFTSRTYELIYVDTTPLQGAAPPLASDGWLSR